MTPAQEQPYRQPVILSRTRMYPTETRTLRAVASDLTHLEERTSFADAGRTLILLSLHETIAVDFHHHGETQLEA